MNDLINYAPLTEAESYTGDKFYKACDVDDFSRIQAENETILFDVSKVNVRSSHIKLWRQADPEDVAIAWELSTMDSSQKRFFEASKKVFLEYFWGAKALTNERIREFARLAKEHKTAAFGR